MTRVKSRDGWIVVASVGALLVWVLTVHSQSELLIGFATIEAKENSVLPVSTALFAFRNAQGVLVAEASVAAVEPMRAGRIFVDASVPTGLALANRSSEDVSASLTLRDGAGAHVKTKNLLIPGSQHRARFVSEPELFGPLPDGFIGSLTFDTTGPGLAALTIRQSVNAHREPLFATLPVAHLETPDPALSTSRRPVYLAERNSSPSDQGSPLILPHLGAGGTLSTQIILINPTSEVLAGEIQLTGSGGFPLSLELDGVMESSFDYRLEPDGVFQGTLTSNSGVFSGYAVVTVEEGGTSPEGTAIFQFRDGSGQLVSEAGVGAMLPTTRARIFVDTIDTRTGVAVASPGNESTEVRFRLLDRNGLGFAETSRPLPPGGHLPIFADELFEDLPPGFTGVLEIETDVPIVPITLKLTLNSRGDLILTTLPVADLTRPIDATSLVFPQVGFGVGFSTRIILISTSAPGEAPSTGVLKLTLSDGGALVVPLLGEPGSAFDFRVSGAGTSQLRPGNTAQLSQLFLDPTDPFSAEVAVNTGNQLPLRPVALDSAGNLRDDFPFQFQSLDSDVASVDEVGRLKGKNAGFSTLTIQSGGVILSTTVTVVEVNSAASGLEVSGVAQDLIGRFYVSSSSDHTVRRSGGSPSDLETYAGRSQSAGFRNSNRLASLFDEPSFLALNQADGALYVADTANHLIRRDLRRIRAAGECRRPGTGIHFQPTTWDRLGQPGQPLDRRL